MNRRKVLQFGALSCFGALGPNLSASVQPNKIVAKKNLVLITTEFGYYEKLFLPTVKGDLDSSKLVSLLKPHYNDLTMLKEINQPEIGDGHGRMRGLLSLNTHQTNGPYISLDQFARNRIEQVTRFKSLHLGNSTVVWDKSSSQVPSMFRWGPEKLYNKLFAKAPDAHELERKHRILQSFKAGMPKNPFANNSYRQAIKELEEEIATDVIWEKKPIPEVDFHKGLHFTDPHNQGLVKPFPQHLELVHLALKHKRGQIFTVAPPYIDKTSLGAKNSYHDSGHNVGKTIEATEGLLKIESYIFNSISGFISSLKKSNLLDDTIVMVMGDFNIPGSHKREFNPVVLIGGGFKHQGIVECKEQYRLSHLYVSMLHQMGIDVDEFATFKGDLDKVLT